MCKKGRQPSRLAYLHCFMEDVFEISYLHQKPWYSKWFPIQLQTRLRLSYFEINWSHLNAILTPLINHAISDGIKYKHAISDGIKYCTSFPSIDFPISQVGWACFPVWWRRKTYLIPFLHLIFQIIPSIKLLPSRKALAFYYTSYPFQAP